MHTQCALARRALGKWNGAIVSVPFFFFPPWRCIIVHQERGKGGVGPSNFNLTACHARLSVLAAACRAGAACSGQAASSSPFR